MIYLGAGRTNLPTIAEVWEKRVHDFVFKNRQQKLRIQDGRKVLSFHDNYFDKMKGVVILNCKRKKIRARERDHIFTVLEYFKTNFADIVIANEVKMTVFNKWYEGMMNKQRIRVKNLTKGLFIQLYNDFSKYVDTRNHGVTNAHYFFDKMNIRTCPYCNRQYTFTLDEKNAKTGPEYDHFFDKSDYPLLAVSFYNLVPSCHVCNHVKGAKKTVRVNPFFRGFDSQFVLKDEKDNVLTKVEVLKRGGGVISLQLPVDEPRKTEESGNIETFGLDGLYRMHDDYVADILTKVMAYDNTAQQSLAAAFQNGGYTPQDVYDFVWGSFLDVAQYERRPLSKLTKEVLEQLGIKR